MRMRARRTKVQNSRGGTLNVGTMTAKWKDICEHDGVCQVYASQTAADYEGTSRQDIHQIATQKIYN